MKLRNAAVVATLFMTSACSQPLSSRQVENYRATHALQVAVLPVAMTVFPDSKGRISADEEAGLAKMATGYSTSGEGKVVVEGHKSGVETVVEVLLANGLKRGEIAAAPVPKGEKTVTVRYDGYSVRVPSCGEFASASPANPSNVVSSEWGCSTQRNLGMMIANPRDLVSPSGETAIDSSRNDVDMQRHRIPAPPRETVQRGISSQIGE